jgi:hypothetical protein
MYVAKYEVGSYIIGKSNGNYNIYLELNPKLKSISSITLDEIGANTNLP